MRGSTFLGEGSTPVPHSRQAYPRRHGGPRFRRDPPTKLGDRDRALERLERAAREHLGDWLLLATSRTSDPLRDDEHFVRSLAHVRESGNSPI